MLFSIIVPIYNVEKYLERCLDSILDQTYPDFEALLVDDGSPDRCPQICDEYAKRDPRLRVIHKPNGGLVSARNAGIFAARGDYICYVDGDDWVKPEMLQFVRDKLAESPVALDMVLFAADNVFADRVEEIINKTPEGHYDRARLEKEIFPYLLSDRRRGFEAGFTVQAHTWNKACRRELQQAYYVRDEDIRMFTDVPLSYECLLNCQNVYICNEHLYCYNQTNTQSILYVGKENYLTESFGHLVAYLQQRLGGYGPEIRRQLNDFPVSLIIRACMWRQRTVKSFRENVRFLREGMKKSGLLRYITLRGLPLNPKILVVLLRLHCWAGAMGLCAVKVAQEKKRKAQKTQKE